MDVTAADTAPDGAAALEQAMPQSRAAAATAAGAAAPAAPAAAAAAWLQPLGRRQQELTEVGRPKKKKPNMRAPVPAAPAAAAPAAAAAAWLQPLEQEPMDAAATAGGKTKKRRNGKQRQNESKARATGQERPAATW